MTVVIFQPQNLVSTQPIEDERHGFEPGPLRPSIMIMTQTTPEAEDLLANPILDLDLIQTKNRN